MRLVLRLKLKHHHELRQQLLDTGILTIIEDVTSRPTGRASSRAQLGRTENGSGRTSWARLG